MEHKNLMLEETLRTGEMINTVFWGLEAEVRQILSVQEIYDCKLLYLVGCGDSYIAGVSTEMAFSKLAGVTIRPITAMQARYTAPIFLPEPEKRVLAIGLSNSGETARTVEAMMLFRNAGAKTLAVTCKPDSRMGKSCDAVLEIPSYKPKPIPGVNSYLIAMLAFYLLAIRMGEVKGRITMDEAGTLRKELYSGAGIIGEKLQEKRDELDRFSETVGKLGEVTFLGCGPLLGTAQYGAAKVLESVGCSVDSADTEEFCHTSYFRCRPERIATVLFSAPGGYGESRVRETEEILKSLGRPYLILEEKSMSEMFASLSLSVQAAYFAARLTECFGGELFRGHQGVWSETGIQTVRNSEIITRFWERK